MEQMIKWVHQYYRINDTSKAALHYTYTYSGSDLVLEVASRRKVVVSGVDLGHSLSIWFYEGTAVVAVKKVKAIDGVLDLKKALKSRYGALEDVGSEEYGKIRKKESVKGDELEVELTPQGFVVKQDIVNVHSYGEAIESSIQIGGYYSDYYCIKYKPNSFLIGDKVITEIFYSRTNWDSVDRYIKKTVKNRTVVQDKEEFKKFMNILASGYGGFSLSWKYGIMYNKRSWRDLEDKNIKIEIEMKCEEKKLSIVVNTGDAVVTDNEATVLFGLIKAPTIESAYNCACKAAMLNMCNIRIDVKENL